MNITITNIVGEKVKEINVELIYRKKYRLTQRHVFTFYQQLRLILHL